MPLREFQQAISGKCSAEIELNDIVIIYDIKQQQDLWRIGKLEQLLTGAGGNRRGVELRTGKTETTIQCPVNKLYPLVITSNGNGNAQRDVPIEMVWKGRRQAAVTGELHRKFGNVA